MQLLWECFFWLIVLMNSSECWMFWVADSHRRVLMISTGRSWVDKGRFEGPAHKGLLFLLFSSAGQWHSFSVFVRRFFVSIVLSSSNYILYPHIANNSHDQIPPSTSNSL